MSIRSRQPFASPRRTKVVTTVNFEPEVLTYLDDLQREFERDRSYLVNALVKEYRRRRERNDTDDAGPATLSKSLSD
jgi:predicted transcriptional regulator